MISQALKNSKQGCLARFAMMGTCRYWNQILANNPLCWEGMHSRLISWFKYSPHLVYSDQGIRLLRRCSLSLEDVLDFDPYDERKSLLYIISRKGDVAMLRFLVSHYGFNAEDARRCDNLALRVAASHGQTSFLEALVELFGLGVDDARARDNDALNSAAENDRIDIIDVLFNRFGLTLQDVHFCPGRDSFHKFHFVYRAMKNESYNVMLELMGKYNLTGFDEKIRNWDLRALQSGNPGVWWAHYDSDFYRVFLAAAQEAHGPEFDE